MAYLIPFGGKEPEISPDAFVAPTAVLIGAAREYQALRYVERAATDTSFGEGGADKS